MVLSRYLLFGCLDLMAKADLGLTLTKGSNGQADSNSLDPPMQLY